MPDRTETKDILGQTIRVGSLVAAPDTKTSMYIGRVRKITPKQLCIENMQGKKDSKGSLGVAYKYHSHVVCLDSIPESLLILLNHNND